MTNTVTIEFTDAWVTTLPKPLSKRCFYRDTTEKGLSLYMTPNGAKSFFIRKRIKGRSERIIIGSADIISVEKARLKSRLIKEQICEGLVPLPTRKRGILKELTLGAHCKDYIKIYSRPHKKTWAHDQRDIDRFFSPWLNRPLVDITRFEVQKLYQKIAEENGMYQANRSIERLKAIYNKAIEWGWQGDNPARFIKRHREKSRERFIQPHEMPYLIQALDNEPSAMVRDYFWMMLFTGARKTNMLTMRWEQINWHQDTWCIPDTKNGESLTLPLTDKAIALLKERYTRTTSEWVFPSVSDSEKHFINAKRAWRRMITRATIYQWYDDIRIKPLIDEAQAMQSHARYNDQWMRLIRQKATKAEIKLPTGLMDTRIHDIRRTFGTYQAINGTNLQVIGRSLGHKCEKSTLVYARLNLDPVRASIKQATDIMLGADV